MGAAPRLVRALARRLLGSGAARGEGLARCRNIHHPSHARIHLLFATGCPAGDRAGGSGAWPGGVRLLPPRCSAASPAPGRRRHRSLSGCGPGRGSSRPGRDPRGAQPILAPPGTGAERAPGGGSPRPAPRTEPALGRSERGGPRVPGAAVTARGAGWPGGRAGAARPEPCSSPPAAAGGSWGSGRPGSPGASEQGSPDAAATLARSPAGGRRGPLLDAPQPAPAWLCKGSGSGSSSALTGPGALLA